MPSATKTCDALTAGLDVLNFARGFTRTLVDKTPDDQLFKKPCKDANHVAWIMGHIATTDDFFMRELGGTTRIVPESWDKLFGMNCTLTENPKDYPSRKELLDMMDKTRKAFIGYMSSLDEAKLFEPIEGDLSQFAKHRAMLVSTIAWHEGFHTGQLSVARRACGQKPLY